MSDQIKCEFDSLKLPPDMAGVSDAFNTLFAAIDGSLSGHEDHDEALQKLLAVKWVVANPRQPH